jgi:predicted Zn finger-like uncharacterized protein
MKITCQSCQSKYNVADEKVQGKIVMIRCRKCGATIVVDGTTASAAANGANAGLGGAESSAQSAGGADANGAAGDGAAAQWHVNVAENDQRSMSLSELVDAYNSSVVTQDTFIWTDGMDDWKPLGEVEPVVAALHSGAAAAEAAAPAASTKASNYGFGDAAPATSVPSFDLGGGVPPVDEGLDQATRVYDSSSASQGYGAEPYVAAAAAAAPAKAEPKRAAVVKRDARARDLFASRADDGPGAFDVQTSAPTFARATASAPVDDDASKRTGERNENSVLFSLAVLTQTAEQRAPAADSGSSDDSGLIDLKALAMKTESMRPAAIVADASVFAPPLGAVAPLSAPMGVLGSPLGDAQPKSRLPMIIGGIAGFALLLIAAGVIGAKFFAGGTTDATTAPSASAAVASPSASAETEAAPSASAQPSATASAAPSASVASTAKPKVFTGGGAPHPQGGGAKPAAASGGGGDTPAAATPPPPKKTSDCGCNGDLMCLMKCSTH